MFWCRVPRTPKKPEIQCPGTKKDWQEWGSLVIMVLGILDIWVALAMGRTLLKI